MSICYLRQCADVAIQTTVLLGQVRYSIVTLFQLKSHWLLYIFHARYIRAKCTTCDEMCYSSLGLFRFFQQCTTDGQFRMRWSKMLFICGLVRYKAFELKFNEHLQLKHKEGQRVWSMHGPKLNHHFNLISSLHDLQLLVTFEFLSSFSFILWRRMLTNCTTKTTDK